MGGSRRTKFIVLSVNIDNLAQLPAQLVKSQLSLQYLMPNYKKWQPMKRFYWRLEKLESN